MRPITVTAGPSAGPSNMVRLDEWADAPVGVQVSLSGSGNFTVQHSFDDPNDLELGCSVNGEPMQAGHTRELIFGVPELIEQLSRVTPLLPGDLIFTGTPPGVGMGRNPPRWLAPGDVLTSYIEGIGQMRHQFVASGPRGRDANSDPKEER